MTTVLIRQLDDQVIKRLEQRAAGNNRSLESEVRHILEQAAGDRYGGKDTRLTGIVQEAARTADW